VYNDLLLISKPTAVFGCVCVCVCVLCNWTTALAHGVTPQRKFSVNPVCLSDAVHITGIQF